MMGVIDLRLSRRTPHLRHIAFSRYGEWKLAAHYWHNLVPIKVSFIFSSHSSLGIALCSVRSNCRRGLPI